MRIYYYRLSGGDIYPIPRQHPTKIARILRGKGGRKGLRTCQSAIQEIQGTLIRLMREIAKNSTW